MYAYALFVDVSSEVSLNVLCMHVDLSMYVCMWCKDMSVYACMNELFNIIYRFDGKRRLLHR